jgi:hypothetical protein
MRSGEQFRSSVIHPKEERTMEIQIPTDEAIERLLLRIEAIDADDADRFEAAYEHLGHDNASRVEMVEEMRAYLVMERRLGRP